MRSFLCIFLAVILSAAVSFAIVSGSGPTTTDLDASIVSIKADISSAQAEAALYSGGLLLAQIQLRKAVSESALSMLEQKRTSILRGISLTYLDPIPRIAVPYDGDAAAAELAKARADVADAEQEASRYSGGLIQTMALLRGATAKMTLVAIDQRIAFAKLGIPLPSLPLAAGSPAQSPVQPPGKATSDKDALQ